MVYHAIATLVVVALLARLVISSHSSSLGVALLKFGIVASNQQWYKRAKIQLVAMLETGLPLFSHHCCPLSFASTLNNSLNQH